RPMVRCAGASKAVESSTTGTLSRVRPATPANQPLGRTRGRQAGRLRQRHFSDAKNAFAMPGTLHKAGDQVLGRQTAASYGRGCPCEQEDVLDSMNHAYKCR